MNVNEKLSLKMNDKVCRIRSRMNKLKTLFFNSAIKWVTVKHSSGIYVRGKFGNQIKVITMALNHTLI